MKYTLRFNEINIHDVAKVGGKNASLGEMYQALSPQGIKVPNGFATTADAFRYYLKYNALADKINDLLHDLDTRDVDQLAQVGARIRHLIANAVMPEDLGQEIRQAYTNLEAEYGENPDVAVRSSATAEDLPNASFAGQQETYLNIRGSQNLLKTCQQVFASLFTDRAISYRVDQGFAHMDVALSIGVQKMVRSDLACSGVMFSIDTETGFRDAAFITAAYGLGENVVQGAVNPDEFYVYKPKLTAGYQPIIKRQLGEKAIKMIYNTDPVAGISIKNIVVPADQRNQFSITDDEVLTLARHATHIEAHYGHPMDIEWAKDGETGELFIVQARPETVKSAENLQIQEIYTLQESGELVITGKSVGQKIATGQARVILQASQMNELKPGEVLVTDITDPDWEPVMKIASAIVTNRGGRTCHAAIIARELGIPAVVGTGHCTDAISTGQAVTISCAEGDDGYIYQGLLSFKKEQLDLSSQTQPNTKLMLNLANPALAFDHSRLPVEGVGLARLEFIINTSIGIHPRALLEPEKLDVETQDKINKITAGYPSTREFYIQRLAEGIGTIAAAFYPRQVIVRMSDFKSNEYAALIGGEQFEPKEENPMIGFRGAYRYPSAEFSDCFKLECAAIKRVRETMGFNNVATMIPFVRTVDEGLKVLALMKRENLERGEQGLKVYLMCEIPANALLADEFLEHFDGFSIGSNDLTQLTLGVDRDSGLVSGADERNPAVLKLMQLAIEACHRHKKYVGICGQAPSDFPEITQWLVEQGIDTISLNPDSVMRMSQVVLKAEQQLKQADQ